MNRENALALLHEYTESEALRKHAYAVEAAMTWYADHFECSPQEQIQWGITGLLHDFDYERFPEPTEPNGHPYAGNRILAEQGYPEEMRTAIMGHALYTGVARETLMAKTLFAVDELTGLITASVLVRPDRSIHSLTTKSVKKKMKDKAFARGCSRDDIRQGAEELGIELDAHITNVIRAMQNAADQLSLAGNEKLQQ